jgi:hypothetical protein
MKKNNSTIGRNSIPEEIANEGFTVRLNPEPVYYSPSGASPLICAVVARKTEMGTDPKGKPIERVFYEAVCLRDFKNGALENGSAQPDAVRGEIIRIGEKHQLAQLNKFVGRAAMVAIVPTGKVKTASNQTCWTFSIYGGLMPESEKRLVLAASTSEESFPELLP